MNPKPARNLSLLVAWLVILLTSTLPIVIRQEIFHRTFTANQQAIFALAVLLIALLATAIWTSLRRLRPFLLLFLVLVAIRWIVFNRLDTLPFYRTALRNPSFSVSMLAEQSLLLIITLVVIAVLLLLKRKPGNIFLVPGDLNAPVEPVRWLGVGPGARWKRFGLLLAFFISLGTLAFLIFAGRPPLRIIPLVLPFLPAILLAATFNAFNEEVTVKAALLSVLEDPVGPRQALYMVAAYFGIGHYYGVPYGVIGVILATFLGWILGKSMLETRGLFWAWFIHFWQDVWIFSFMAIGAIIPGGG